MDIDLLFKENSNINIPAIIEVYKANSGLYCFKIIIIINAVNPIPIIFVISISHPL